MSHRQPITLSMSCQLTIETLLICNIIHQQNPHRTSVICRRDGSETFLTSCVPYLQLHSLSIEINRSDLEVDTYRRDE